jgi:hypothetical protein
MNETIEVRICFFNVRVLTVAK